jgi:hypothetical protein
MIDLCVAEVRERERAQAFCGRLGAHGAIGDRAEQFEQGLRVHVFSSSGGWGGCFGRAALA